MLILRYRQVFNLDYWQAFYTPYNVIVRDMQILSLEAEIKESYRAAKQRQKKLSGKK